MSTAKNDTDIKDIYTPGLTDKFPFTTLLKNDIKKGWTNTWYPIPVDCYAKAFKIDPLFDKHGTLSRNLTYSMQYLEFLEKIFAELEVSSVLDAMLIKTYVITGMSVLEGIFANLIWKNNLWRKESKHKLKGYGKSIALQKYEGEQIIVDIQVFKKDSSQPVDEIKLAELIQILENHTDILNIDSSLYAVLTRLRKLRNKVHLQNSDNIKDHDYNAFEDEYVKTEMGAILYEILSCKIVTDTPEYFDFLMPNVEAYNALKNIKTTAKD